MTHPSNTVLTDHEIDDIHRAWQDSPSIDPKDLIERTISAVVERLTVSDAVPESPMAKMAQALREKAEREREDYERRVQSGEWGAAPDAGTEADYPPIHVATIEGDEAQRVLHWNKDVRGFDYAPGTKLYDATALAQARQQGYEAARAEFVAALPGPYYMDPPDGGDVPAIEQIQRISAEVEALRDQALKDRGISDGDDQIVAAAEAYAYLRVLMAISLVEKDLA